jgi:hypothetical protein
MCLGAAMLCGAATLEAREESSASSLRVLDEKLQALVDEVTGYSPTFRELLQALDRSDLIVHVTLERPHVGAADGTLQMVTTVDEHRYLRATIRPGLVARSTVAMLAHELQHARELAEAPSVRDLGAMAHHFANIGTNIAGAQYETDKARAISLKVLREFDAGVRHAKAHPEPDR